MTELRLVIRHELPSDDAIVDRLHERAFGPGRFARTATRIREGAGHDRALSFTALVGTLVVGSVRQTPVAANGIAGHMLGPLTVDPAFEGRGIGAGLMRAAMDAAQAVGSRFIVLVGDPDYYARFGFLPVPPGKVQLPGPVDPARTLYAELAEGGFSAACGLIRAAPEA